jgi:hypothetical protein
VTLAAIGAGIVLVLLGVTGLRDEGSVAAISRTAPPPSTTPDTSAASSSSAAHIEDGGIIAVGTQRFAAGGPGDRVAVGDWNCDGVATPAVLRPASGALFVFDEWATEDTEISVSPAHTIVGAVDLVGRNRGDGCSTLVVIRGDGTEEEVS